MVISDIVDHNQKINGHSITVGWLLESLRQNDKVFQKIHGNKSVKAITAYDVSDGKGFASQILRCTLTFVDSKDSSDIYTTVFKIPGVESLLENIKKTGGADLEGNMQEGIAAAHALESHFYTSLSPIFDGPTPTIFKSQEWIHGKHNGCIHMEDLTRRGKTMSFFDSVNKTQVKKFIQKLAHMNANLLKSGSEEWHGKYLKFQAKMAELATWYGSMFDPFLKQCKKQDEIKQLFDKYQSFLTSTKFHHYAFTQAYKDQKIQPVIVHGDMHPGNIMWAIDENGDVRNEISAFVDWQTIYEGSPMSDLARFLAMCTSGTVRRQAEEFAIDYYLECLTKEFNGDVTKVLYTKAQLRISYNYAFLTQVVGIVSGATFFIQSCKEENVLLKNAYWDVAELKALHACEDAARLLENEMNDVFEKFNV